MAALFENPTHRLKLLADLEIERKRRKEAQSESAMSEFKDDPYGFVMWAWRWGMPGTLALFEGPDEWQKQFLMELGEHVKKRAFDGRNPVAPIRMTVSSGHGSGKGTLAAWLTCWIMSTRPYAQGTVTANTYDQLENKTWAGIQRWFNSSRTASNFAISASGVKHKLYGKEWKCTPQTCREENSEAFAGQHAATSTSFYIFDEASAIPEKIWEVAEGGLSDGAPMIFAFGNPTRSSGKFHRINFGSDRARWDNRTIDSRSCMMPNKKQIDEWKEDYGEDSDFFRVRVAGLPPQSSDIQYIDSMRVWEAQKRKVDVLDGEPLIAGVDLARGGGDNAVIRFRRGNDARSIRPVKIPAQFTRDSTLLIAKLADMAVQTYNGQKVAAWFLDGGGVGGPIIDRMVQLGHSNFIEVQFGGACPDPKHYMNMRSWMWSKMRDALGSGLAIDKDKELETDLTGVGIGKPDKTDRIVLESKDSMKARGMASPDDGDALALTWAHPVALEAKPQPPPDTQSMHWQRGGGGGGNWMG